MVLLPILRSYLLSSETQPRSGAQSSVPGTGPGFYLCRTSCPLSYCVPAWKWSETELSPCLSPLDITYPTLQARCCPRLTFPGRKLVLGEGICPRTLRCYGAELGLRAQVVRIRSLVISVLYPSPGMRVSKSRSRIQ